MHGHCFIILIGQSGNGKSALANVISKTVQPYKISAVVAAGRMTAFMLHGAEHATTILFMEMPEDHRELALGVEQFKALAGGDPVVVNEKYKKAGEPRRYQPVAITNNLPDWPVRCVSPCFRWRLTLAQDLDGAMKNRSQLIPFPNVVPDQERRADLAVDLQSESAAAAAFGASVVGYEWVGFLRNGGTLRQLAPHFVKEARVELWANVRRALRSHPPALTPSPSIPQAATHPVVRAHLTRNTLNNDTLMAHPGNAQYMIDGRAFVEYCRTAYMDMPKVRCNTFTEAHLESSQANALLASLGLAAVICNGRVCIQGFRPRMEMRLLSGLRIEAQPMPPQFVYLDSSNAPAWGAPAVPNFGRGRGVGRGRGRGAGSAFAPVFQQPQPAITSFLQPQQQPQQQMPPPAPRPPPPPPQHCAPPANPSREPLREIAVNVHQAANQLRENVYDVVSSGEDLQNIPPVQASSVGMRLETRGRRN